MRKRIMIALGLLLTIFVGAGLIYGALTLSLGGFLGVGNGCPASFPWKIEQNARFQLPPSYINLESYCVFGQGWLAAANFERPPMT